MNALVGLKNTAAEPDERLRRTALVLHGLTAEDREWLLAQLPEAEAAKLRQLLGELIELGLPCDPSLVRSALSAAQPVARTPANHAVLAAATVASAHECLASEPDRFVAAVLAAQRWPWAEELIVHLGPARAQRLGELARAWRAPEALQEAALAVLARKLVANVETVVHEGAPAGNRPRGAWWHRFVRRSDA